MFYLGCTLKFIKVGDALFINLAVYVWIKFIEVGAEFGGNLGDT